MAKATILLPSGATAVLEGTVDEIAQMTQRLEANDKGGLANDCIKPNRPNKAKNTAPTGIVTELIDGGFFSVPRTLSDVVVEFRRMGRFYPSTTLAPTLLRLVRARKLRRIKESKNWTYVV